MSAALDSLCGVATAIVADYAGTRRPSWAPAMQLDDEFLRLLGELRWLKADDQPIARLWALYSDPKSGPVTCNGFEFRCGKKSTGRGAFVAWKRKDGTWRNGPEWQPPKPGTPWAERYPMAVRATALAGQRVAEFAEHPKEQMLIGGALSTWCAICGRALSDPISLERGIGPECFSVFGKVAPLLDGGSQ